MQKTQNEKISKEQIHNKLFNLILTAIVLMMALLSFSTRTFATNEILPYDISTLESNTISTRLASNLNYDSFIFDFNAYPSIYETDNLSIFSNLKNYSYMAHYTFIANFEYIGSAPEMTLSEIIALKNHTVSLFRLEILENGVSSTKKVLINDLFKHKTTLTIDYDGYLSNVLGFLPIYGQLPSTVTYFKLNFTNDYGDYLISENYKLNVYLTTDNYLTILTDNYIKPAYDVAYTDGYNAGYLEGADSVSMEEAYQDGYDFGYSQGLLESEQSLGTIYQTAYNKGFQDSLSQNQPIIYEQGYLAGQNAGYQDGLQDAEQNPIISMITQAFGSVGTILNVELLPSITLGTIILVPILFGIIAFILGKRKGD